MPACVIHECREIPEEEGKCVCEGLMADETGREPRARAIAPSLLDCNSPCYGWLCRCYGRLGTQKDDRANVQRSADPVCCDHSRTNEFNGSNCWILHGFAPNFHRPSTDLLLGTYLVRGTCAVTSTLLSKLVQRFLATPPAQVPPQTT